MFSVVACSQTPQVTYGMIVLWLFTIWSYWYHLALFPGLPYFGSSVYIQYNTWKRKSGEKHGRPGNTYHVNDIRWTEVDTGGEGCAFE